LHWRLDVLARPADLRLAAKRRLRVGGHILRAQPCTKPGPEAKRTPCTARAKPSTFWSRFQQSGWHTEDGHSAATVPSFSTTGNTGAGAEYTASPTGAASVTKPGNHVAWSTKTADRLPGGHCKGNSKEHEFEDKLRIYFGGSFFQFSEFI